MIQITAQMRVLVAIESVDGGKGIDSLVRLCREKLDEDLFSSCVFVFRSRRGPRFGSSATMARDTGWRRNGSRNADSCGGRKGTNRPSHWKPTRRKC